MKKTFRKVLATLLAAVMLLTAAPLSGIADIDFSELFAVKASALNPIGSCGTNVTYKFDSYTGLLTISGTGEMSSCFAHNSLIKTVVIENGVNNIDRCAFDECINLTSIEIPNSVRTIEDGAFVYCSSLTSVTIPKNVVEIGEDVFLYCTSLSSIIVDENNSVYCSDEYGVLYNKYKTELIQYPSGNPRKSFSIPYGVRTLAMRAFSDCSSLSSIEIPKTLTNLGTTGFHYCGNLTNISVDELNGTYSSDEHGVLYNNKGTELIQYPTGNERKTFNIPDGVKTIDSYSFYKCANLTNVTIPDSVTSICRYAFYNCTNLSDITIPNSVTSIGDDAFANCSGLKNVTLPYHITTIPYGAFTGCKSLTSIEIPDSVTRVNPFAFSTCSGLTSITIPKNVTSIDYFAFKDCTNLKDVYYGGTEEQWNTIDISDSMNSDLLNADIHYDSVTHTHSYESAITKEATCTETGVTTYTCRICDDTYTEDIPLIPHSLTHVKEGPTCTKDSSEYDVCSECGNKFNIVETGIKATGHSYTLAVTNEATCAETGFRLYICSCGDRYTEEIPLAEHSLTHVKEDPTCTEAGMEYDICSECGKKVNKKTIKATGHSYTSEITKEATCTEKGVLTYTCSCGDTYTEDIPTVEHTLTHVTEDPTCTKDGAEYDICSECGNKFNEETIKATGHNYTSAVTKEATCTEKGVMTYVCPCGDTYTEDIPLVAHSLTHVKEDPTCTKDGTEYDICSECGNKFNEETIKATGHNYTSAVTKDATCTEKGVLTYTCSCGDTYTEDIPTVEHTLTHVTEDPTCTKDGTEYDICSKCGNKFNEETIKATGHNYTSAVTKEATCTEKGVLTYICSCGDTYTEDIPLVAHSLTHVKENPTCTKDGTEYDICSECGNRFNEETIKATGHSYTSVITKEATCTEKGVLTYTCSCGDTYTEDIPLVAHSLTHVKENPTCTKDGTEYDICSECGNRFNEETIKATGHSYTSVITKEATCTEKGVLTYTCSCGDTYTEDIPTVEHTLTHVTEDPTCTKDGTEYDICSECGNKFNEETIKATGHSYTSVVTKEATCTEKGVMTYVCPCGDTYTEDIPLAEHRLIHYVEKATCTEDGKSYDICSECGGTFNEAVIKATDHTYENGICVFCGKVESWNYILDSGIVTITGYTGHEKNLDVPAKIGGYPVTSISDSAFAYNGELEYVSFPNSVFVIGKDAFRGCTNLKEVSISDSVSTICEGAFADCESLAIVYIESVNTVISGAFSNNDNRLTLIVPDGTKTAGNVAAEGLAYNTYMYPKEKDGKGAIAISGTVTLYQDLEYNYWSKLIEKYPYAFYLYFDELIFDGIKEDELIIDTEHIDTEAQYLTMNEVYISLTVDGKYMTFRDLIEMIEKGELEAVFTFTDSKGMKRTFFQKIGDFFENVFNVLSKAINAIVRVFKKK